MDLDLELLLRTRVKKENLERLAAWLGLTLPKGAHKNVIALLVRNRIQRDRMVDGLRKLTGERR